jgi:DNA (cytosine-5)-methyltransferase 1
MNTEQKFNSSTSPAIVGNTMLQAVRVLNLYAGIGGNRKLWEGCEVTAVEYNQEIAQIYQDHYPNDKVVVGDAHEYLLKHYKEFDFIWSSPPCQTHSKVRMMASKSGSYDVKFPDMKLWQEIIFLQHFADCKFVVENVIPYYEPFVKPTIELERHFFWSNFRILPFPLEKIERHHNHITGKTNLYGYDLTKYKIKHRKDQIIRNMVNPDLGLYIFEQFLGQNRKVVTEQQSLFGDEM